MKSRKEIEKRIERLEERMNELVEEHVEWSEYQSRSYDRMKIQVEQLKWVLGLED